MKHPYDPQYATGYEGRTFIHVPSSPLVKHFEVVLEFKDGFGVMLNEQMGTLPYFELLSPVDLHGNFLARIPRHMVKNELSEDEMHDIWALEAVDHQLLNFAR